MSRFPTAAHLASWAGLCPGNNESAGWHRSGTTRKGNKELCQVLTECAWAAGRTSTYLGTQFRRFHRRFGKKGGRKAAIATAHTLIVIIWHVLAETTAYNDLGSDYFTRRIDTPETHKRRLIRELEALGHRVPSNPTPHSRSPASDHRPTRHPTGSPTLPPERAWSPQLRLRRPRRPGRPAPLRADLEPSRHDRGSDQPAIIYYLVPIFTGLSAWLLLDEPIGPAEIASMILVIAGVSISQLSRPRGQAG